ncbi:MAG: sugar ABC transporter permease [Oscillospiraceae bacterium]|nr:sugar ABC transporter permease [Oscillospiraceae bacterium]
MRQNRLSKKGNGTALVSRLIQPYAYQLPVIVLMTCLLFVPIILVISYSFYDNVIVNDNPVWVGFANYKELLTEKNFVKSIGNTAVFVVFNVVFHLLIGMAMALMVNAKSLGSGAKATFRIIYMLPWMFNATVIAILWKLLLNPSGVVNQILMSVGVIDLPVAWFSERSLALGVLTFINIWGGYPFYMISILAGLQGISADLYEAAAVDGATGVQQFFYISLPQLKPILISIAMLDFIWTTQNFSLIWLLTGGGPSRATEMMSTYVYKTAFSSYQYSKASTAAVIILLVCVVLAIFYVRNQNRED